MLFVRHEPTIRAFVLSLQPMFSDADDILQETFLTVSRKAETFAPGTNFIAWACSIARLKTLEHHRRQRRANALNEEALIALADAAPDGAGLEARAEALRQCLQRIMPKARDLLWRRYTVRQTSEEMADALGMTALAVRVALSKARAFLRDCVVSELRKAH